MKPKQSLFRIAIVALASAAAAAAGGVADAVDDSRQPSKLFLQLDTSHDGYVSRSETANAERIRPGVRGRQREQGRRAQRRRIRQGGIDSPAPAGGRVRRGQRHHRQGQGGL